MPNELKTKYSEISALFNYCISIGINAEFAHLYDGYTIIFPNESDFIQHYGSYGCNEGCVEPAIGCRLDYHAVTLRQAKRLVRYHKDRLNRRTSDERD